MSNILDPYRAIGIVTSSLPFVVNSLGSENFLTVPVGSAFQVYKCDRLTLAIVSPQLSHDIRCVDVNKDITFTSVGADIIVWKRAKQVNKLHGHHNAHVAKLLVFGEELLSLDDNGVLHGWDLKSGSHNFEIDMGESMKLPTAMIHPPTYLNKVVVASESGEVQLWNIRSQKCIYSFRLGVSRGAFITCMANSTAIDVVAFGTSDNKVIIHNLKTDKTLMEFKHDSPITSLSFRSDTGGLKGAFTSMLAVGDASGQIALWDLEKNRLHVSLDDAHTDVVVSLAFLPGQPVLVSSSSDNSIKMWVFDSLDGTPRLLKYRAGHKAPPRRIRYYGGTVVATAADGADGTSAQILSAGGDRAFRVFHAVREQQSIEMSQGKLQKKAKSMSVPVESLKLTPIVDFASGEAREKDWNNVITAHEDDNTAYTWSFENRALGQHKLTPPTKLNVMERVCSVCISPCGNFGLVGHSTGRVFKYNMQSGLFNGSFPKEAKQRVVLPNSKSMEMYTGGSAIIPGGSGGHTLAVTGVAVGALNRTLITASLDGELKFWNFSSQILLESVSVGSPISQIVLHRDSDLIAVACDDTIVRVYDASTHRLVRRFAGHGVSITDMAFSPNARWLLTAASDSSLRVWDMPSSRCVDWAVFDTVITGLSFSPTSEFIATSHAGNLGIFLWANKGYFGTVYLDQAITKPYKLHLPNELSYIGFDDEDVTEQSYAKTFNATDSTRVGPFNTLVKDGESSMEVVGSGEKTVVPLAVGAATLSGLPKSKWNTLDLLDLIRARNKPTEGPKEPEKAPFFLKQLPGLTDAWAEPLPNADEGKESTRIVRSSGDRPVTKLEELLHQAVSSEGDDSVDRDSDSDSDGDGDGEGEEVGGSRGQYYQVMKYLLSLSPSGVDLQLRSLCSGLDDEQGVVALGLMLDAIESEIKSRRFFEIVQAYLSLLLKLHGSVIVKNEALTAKIEAISKLQTNSWSLLQDMFNHGLCLVNLFSDIQT